MRALVTGGGGFIGQALAPRLMAAGVAVTILDIAERPTALAGLDLDYRLGSVLDAAAVAAQVAKADLVISLAGIAEPMRYGAAPLDTMDVNLLGSINVARACAEKGAALLFASTSEVYGMNPDVPWREDANRVLGPVSNVRWCYSTAKAAAEHYVDACRRQLGLDYAVIRLFNAYGPGLTGRVVDGFIRAALAGEPLVINGDGRQTRSFCYGDDVADAIARIATGPMTGAATYNIGTSEEVAIADLAALTVELTGSVSPIVMRPYTEVYDGYEDIPRRAPDASAIARDFGWAPTTSLRDGLALTIAAMRGDA